MSSKHVFRGICAAGGVLLLAGAAAPGVAAVVTADSGDVRATVRKTVLQTATAEAEILTSRMYTQVTAAGTGTKTVTVPVGVDSNRNLNAFGAFPMEGQSAVFELTPDGSQEERILTDADIKPIEVSVKVLLDGQEVAPADLVGAAGVVDVQYTVRNTTSRTESVTFTDAAGEEVTQDVEVADPFAGSLDVALPKGFNEITAPGATVAGDGTNQTTLGYTFVLFPPLGATEVTVGYQARITNGEMPAAVFSFLPIVPFDNATIAGTAEAYRSGAQTGSTIAGAGQQIGENLLKLQEGAGQLLAGLGQLSAGADQLSDGLVNTAAPGSAQLADGANQVSDGLSQLNSNVPALADGVDQLNDGAQQLDDGAEELAAGNKALAAAIATLSEGVNKLPQSVKAQVESDPTYKAALDTLSRIIAGIGQPSDQTPATLLGGLNLIQAGLRFPGTTDCPSADPQKCGVGDANDLVSKQLTGAVPSLDALGKGIRDTATGYCALVPAAQQPACLGTFDALATCVDGSTTCNVGAGDQATIEAQTLAAANALAKTVVAIDKRIVPGVLGVKAALFNPNQGQCDPSAAPGTAKACGISQALTIIKGGIPVLVDQIAQSIRANLLGNSSTPGIGVAPASANCDPELSLVCASAALAAGSAQLAGGTAQLADGTSQLDSQVPTLASGVAQLDDGAAQVADGADQLAAGLGDAADGSGQLADGLGQAEPGAGQIQDGAGQLKEQGADELVKSGSDAQLGFAADVALLEAQQALGEQGAGIPFGPAEGTDTITTGAIQLQLAGIAADTNNNAVNFVLGGVLLAGAGGAAAYAARRRATA